MSDKISEAEKTAEFIVSRPYGAISMGDPIKARDDMRKLITIELNNAFKAGEAQALDWVEKEVIGDDEVMTVVTTKYGTDTGEMVQTIGDGELEWKEPRNELRANQRQLIKQKKNDNI